MALQFSFNHESGATFPEAYGWYESMYLNFRTSDGALTLTIHPTAQDASDGKPPISIRGVRLGAELTPGVTFPTLAELMADPEFAAAWNFVKGKLYASLKPAYPGAIDV